MLFVFFYSPLLPRSANVLIGLCIVAVVARSVYSQRGCRRYWLRMVSSEVVLYHWNGLGLL